MRMPRVDATRGGRARRSISPSRFAAVRCVRFLAWIRARARAHGDVVVKAVLAGVNYGLSLRRGP